MLSCRDLVHQHASDYLDQQLQGRSQWRVTFHLLICGHCRRFMKKMRLVRKVLAKRPEPVDEKNALALADKLHQSYLQQNIKNAPHTTQ